MVRAAIAGAIGAFLGGVVGIVSVAPDNSTEDKIGAVLIVGFFGSLSFAAIPLAIAGWFILLRMLEQAAEAVKGPPKP
jgi:hypothetical protein